MFAANQEQAYGGEGEEWRGQAGRPLGFREARGQRQQLNGQDGRRTVRSGRNRGGQEHTRGARRQPGSGHGHQIVECAAQRWNVDVDHYGAAFGNQEGGLRGGNGEGGVHRQGHRCGSGGIEIGVARVHGGERECAGGQRGAGKGGHAGSIGCGGAKSGGAAQEGDQAERAATRGRGRDGGGERDGLPKRCRTRRSRQGRGRIRGTDGEAQRGGIGRVKSGVSGIIGSETQRSDRESGGGEGSRAVCRDGAAAEHGGAVEEAHCAERRAGGRGANGRGEHDGLPERGRGWSCEERRRGRSHHGEILRRGGGGGEIVVGVVGGGDAGNADGSDRGRERGHAAAVERAGIDGRAGVKERDCSRGRPGGGRDGGRERNRLSRGHRIRIEPQSRGGGRFVDRKAEGRGCRRGKIRVAGIDGGEVLRSAE